MATICSALNTAFTPVTGSFNVQVSGGNVQLERRNTSGAAWAVVGPISAGLAVVVDTPVAGADYRFVGMTGSPTVQADQ
jgi:hypothetical protein